MPSVAVLGGGYAGIKAVRRLDALLDSRWSITLVDRETHHQLTTRLPEIVGGRIATSRACIPYRRIVPRRITLHQAEVLGVDPVTRRVETDSGSLTPDWLVVALGGWPHFLGVPQAEQHGMVMRSVNDARSFRERVQELVLAQREVRVVIVGAGYTGTEIAGELADWNADLRRAKPDRVMTVTVVALDARLLPEGNVRLAAIAEAVLRSKGVHFLLGRSVRSVERGHLTLDTTELPADVVLWAARSRASSALRVDEARRGREGRVQVDPYLRAVGFERLYLAGDMALAYDYRRDRPAPTSAQLAVEEGELAARNIVAEIEGRPLREFGPTQLGEALSLGKRDGAAEVAGFVLWGRAALVAKQAALLRYLRSLGGVQLAREYA